jgi:hypothetical protein
MHSPPGVRLRADFEEEMQRAVRLLEEDGVPAGMSRTVGLNAVEDFDGLRPTIPTAARDPDADVLVSFVGTGEPRGDEAGRRLGDGRRVA